MVVSWRPLISSEPREPSLGAGKGVREGRVDDGLAVVVALDIHLVEYDGEACPRALRADNLRGSL